MRVLVTGSRTWTDKAVIHHALAMAWRLWDSVGTLTIVHGGALGADAIANAWGTYRKERGWLIDVECHPADWDGLGKSAGPVRNQEMIGAGADLCLAFIHNKSRGASHCAAIARQAGINTIEFHWHTQEVHSGLRG